MPPEVPDGPTADVAVSALPPVEEVKDADGEMPDCKTFCGLGGETAGLAADEEGEKLKEDDDIAEGVATGGAEGKGLKLVEGDVERAADDAFEGDAAIAVDIPSVELRDSDLPCVPLLCIESELERCEPDGTWYDKPGEEADMDSDAVGGDKVFTAVVGEYCNPLWPACARAGAELAEAALPDELTDICLDLKADVGPLTPGSV